MGDDLSMSLRFAIAFVLSIVYLVVPAWADYQAGMDAYNRRDYTKALREWQPLAEQGDASAQFCLGLLYENGDGVPRDYDKARQWYEKAAAQGEAKAQFYLGRSRRPRGPSSGPHVVQPGGTKRKCARAWISR